MKTKFRIATTAALLLGFILVSQAMSFGRWNDYQTPGQNFNFHALLLFGAGIAICTLTAAISLLSVRLRHLEQHLEELNVAMNSKTLEPTAPSGRGSLNVRQGNL